MSKSYHATTQTVNRQAVPVFECRVPTKYHAIEEPRALARWEQIVGKVIEPEVGPALQACKPWFIKLDGEQFGVRLYYRIGGGRTYLVASFYSMDRPGHIRHALVEPDEIPHVSFPENKCARCNPNMKYVKWLCGVVERHGYEWSERIAQGGQA